MPEGEDAVGIDEAEAFRTVARRLVPPGGCSVPRPPSGLVARERLLDRIAARADVACVLVAAPAGYGKTTILADLAIRDDRPNAWLTLGPADGDPTILLARVLLALDALEPVGGDTFKNLLLSHADLKTVRLPRLAALLERRQPFLLVLDDVHRLDTDTTREIMRVLVEHCSSGSRVAIATRDASSLGFARARANGRIIDIDMTDLTMSIDEGHELLAAAGFNTNTRDMVALVDKAEGWPAGLYLYALAHRDGSDKPVGSVDTDQGFVAEYLRDEILATADPELADFMLETSLLDKMTGSLCDAMLERTGSVAVIDELVRTNRFVVPMDERGSSYRYHNLFQDLLRAELLRRTPERLEGLHARASDWFELHDDIDSAIQHAHAAGHPSRVAALIWCSALQYVSSGRVTTVQRWLNLFSPGQTTADPALSLAAAWCAFTQGDPSEVMGWTDSAELADGEEVLPNGVPRRAAVALLRALIGRDGLSQVRSDAVLADELDRPDSPFRPIAVTLEGDAARLLGDVDHARECFERATAHAAISNPALQAHGLAALASLAAEADRWRDAETLCTRALGVVDQHGLHEYIEACSVFSIAALTAAKSGATTEARERAKFATVLVERMRGVTPWIAIESRILLARVNIFLGSTADAARLLSEAERLLETYPDSGTLPHRLAAAREQVTDSEVPLGISVTPLTAAELRVLRYLPTHLNFAQIAAELFISRNTVKSQAVAVYRKLEVSSRGEAVERARGLGIIEATRQ